MVLDLYRPVPERWRGRIYCDGCWGPAAWDCTVLPARNWRFYVCEAHMHIDPLVLLEKWDLRCGIHRTPDMREAILLGKLHEREMLARPTTTPGRAQSIPSQRRALYRAQDRALKMKALGRQEK